MKKMPRKIAVIGLGNFGSSLARELVNQKAEVVAVDIKQDLVNDISSEVYNAICFDCTNEKQLRGYGIGNVDIAIVAIGEDFGSTVMITKILKDMKVTVYSRASSYREKKILEAVGADKIYRPEHEQGVTAARAITYSEVKEYAHVGDSDMDIIVTEPDKSIIGRKIRDLDIRRVYGVNIAFFGKSLGDGKYRYKIPNPDDVLEEGDLLWLIGSNENIKRYQER